jgi:hypothetical protein
VTQQQGNSAHREEWKQQTAEARRARQDIEAQREARIDPNMPETNDAGDAISEASLYDASGKATGGGVDTPQHVEEYTEKAAQKHKHIHQGTNAYEGGGADNGSNL